ncbi:MAG: metalloregulator ArsR/SmtB family transcription factor [Phycisphaerae bacterium]|nr:metalloregulator ArsR/SmtB family transcription factor [Phycisphaerae bacterium]
MASRTESGASKWSAWVALVGDTLRRRLLRILEQDELGVGEMAKVLQLPQSTVSRHLKALLDARWIARRNRGTAGLYRLDPESLPAGAAALWSLAREQIDAMQLAADEARLASVLAERRVDSRTFFGRVGGEWDSLRRELFGTAFSAEALLSIVDPQWTVADLGCGTGDAAEHLAPLVRRVIAVDREPTMLDAAKRRLAGHRNIVFRQGALDSLPLKAGEADLAVVMLVMHHLEHPEQAVGECARVLAMQGRLLVVDMVKHDRAAFARTMGHRHLGFTEAETRAWARGTKLQLRRWRMLRADPHGKGPPLFAALFERVA